MKSERTNPAGPPMDPFKALNLICGARIGTCNLPINHAGPCLATGPQPDVVQFAEDILTMCEVTYFRGERKHSLTQLLTDFARSVSEERDKVITDEMEALHKDEVDLLNKWLSDAKAKLQPSPCKVYGHRMCDYSPPHDVQEGYCNTCSAEFSKGECDTGCCLACQREQAAYERGKGER